MESDSFIAFLLTWRPDVSWTWGRLGRPWMRLPPSARAPDQIASAQSRRSNCCPLTVHPVRSRLKECEGEDEPNKILLENYFTSSQLTHQLMAPATGTGDKTQQSESKTRRSLRSSSCRESSTWVALRCGFAQRFAGECPGGGVRGEKPQNYFVTGIEARDLYFL